MKQDVFKLHFYDILGFTLRKKFHVAFLGFYRLIKFCKISNDESMQILFNYANYSMKLVEVFIIVLHDIRLDIQNKFPEMYLFYFCAKSNA